ncbi:hypothetical protein R3W88_013785 [Solanum pinnatisectum]|uniref:Uncharacterized protein n=1 Tax=Solanum pinnatisectum TaxID=50273 RepID=A0AAV9KPW6_9SOLN|nr:hypothetical protein R3W88_013785 [Solanum pinnatisectum]
MAINKNITRIFLIVIVTIFISSKLTWAHEEIPHPHPQPCPPHPNAHPDAHPHPPPQGPEGPVFEFSGRKFKMEQGHEQCYVNCYKGIFGGEGSPLYAEQECYDMCHNHGKFVFPTFSPPPPQP